MLTFEIFQIYLTKKYWNLLTLFYFSFDYIVILDLIENVKKLSTKDSTDDEDRDKSKEVNNTKNVSLNKDENKNKNVKGNKNKDENKDENEIKNESENENILFLRYLTASLCEVLVSKYGHDILNGMTRQDRMTQ